ncbi:MAG: bifunctional ornithine acetyltransferase/N-acetylglutamate synthase, partial [Planctomycetaceae bacterium]|nr:bifunctional ornithine acetyltransferase/N-acetylglutamate synthase [Planctomycetaceae bacterium]
MPIFIPQGFRFAGVHCGLKSDPNLLDLSLIVSDLPATAAGVFTQNLVCGAPVTVNKGRLSQHRTFRAVVGNSRCANSCTGEQGIRDAEEMATLAANAVGGTDEQGLVISTGVIGIMLPMDKVRKGIADAAKKLSSTEDSFIDAARGIMTTDTVEKYVSQQVILSDNRKVNIAGICKGAAMIAPNLA